MGRIHELITSGDAENAANRPGLAQGLLFAVGAATVYWTIEEHRRAVRRHRGLVRRDRILGAVGTGAERLLRTTGPARLTEFLRLLGEATTTSRVYVFENHRDEHQRFVASHRFEWVAPGVPPQIDNPELQSAAYEELGMERWRMLLSRGEAVLGRVADLPASERRVLEPQGIRSVAALPIYIGVEWWGFIGFDETRCDRWWSPAEVDALRTSAGLVAAAVERARADEHVTQLERARAERAAARTAERRARFLAYASHALGATLTYDRIFRELPNIAVPDLGEWCIVDVLEDGAARRCAVEHADPRYAGLAERIRAATPPAGPANPILRVLATGQATIVPRLGEAMIGYAEGGDGTGIGSRPAMIIPLRARDRIVGVLTLLAHEAAPYSEGDLALAHEFGDRASLALDNALLYAEARRATRTRDEMLAIVSHDLRDPLNTISLAHQMLAQLSPDQADAWRAQLDIIDRSVGRASRLIHDLLDVARMEAGTMRLEPRRVRALDIAREAIELHRGQAEASGLALVDHLPDELPDLRADRDRLLQAFANLIGNAMKFTPAGGRVTVGAEPVEGEVRFHVSDTGPGIPADQVPRLFDPFFQAARKREGAGLGLAITRGIVEAYGGRIDVSTELGVGTTISFTVPTDDASA